MERLKNAFVKIEYELPVFLILAVKIPFGAEQMKSFGFSFFPLCAAAAFLLGRVLRRADESVRIFYIFFAALLLSGNMMKSLFMPSFTDAGELFGKAASFLCFLLAVLILRKPSAFFEKPALQWAVPFLCAAGILAGPSFAFFYAPVILILLAYEKHKTGHAGIDPVLLAACVFIGLVCAVLAVPVLAGGQKYLGAVDLGFVFKILKPGDIFSAVITVFPLLILFPALWFLAYKNAPGKRLKTVIALCAAEPFFIALLNLFFYYPASDGWKYYIFTAFFTQFCLLFYFWDSREKAVAQAAEKLGILFKNKPYLVFIAMVWLIKSADILVAG